MSKIKHENVCENCGKLATIFLQDNWSVYDIDDYGECTERSNYEGNDSHYYCDKCAEEEGLI